MFRSRLTFSSLAVAAALLGPVSARAESYLTVDNVQVDVTAANAAAARDQAIAVAQAKAFDQLIKQIVANPADQARLHPSQDAIESFVQDFGVDNERVSTVRYIGLYSVRFKASLIDKYLADSGVTASNEQALEVAPAAGTDGAAPAPAVTGPTTAYAVAMAVGSVGDWVRLHNQLAGMTGVAHVSLDALTRDGAAVTLDYAGDLSALQGALANGGLALVQTGPNGFQLQPAGAEPHPPVPPQPRLQ